MLVLKKQDNFVTNVEKNMRRLIGSIVCAVGLVFLLIACEGDRTYIINSPAPEPCNCEVVEDECVCMNPAHENGHETGGDGEGHIKNHNCECDN